MTRRVVAGLVVLVALSLARAAVPPSAPVDATPIGHELDAIREQLVALDIENALMALNAILERSDLSEAARIAALDLRAQAHVASDALDAAEEDYRALLALRPDYSPSRELTSKKAMERFLRLHATMIGTVRLDVDPTDASLTVDDRPVSIPTGGVIPVAAGKRRLRLAHKGFDAQDVDVEAVAARETPVTLRLVPNARSLVARTDIDGVSITLDGIAAGVTARGGEAAPDGGAPATLVIENVAIGEHELGFAKPCFAPEHFEELVSVDLADRTAKLLRVVAMRPSRTRVIATGAIYDGELRVDGERMAALPLKTFEICPGQRTLEVVASGRVVWSGTLAAEESDMTLDLSPRPSAVLVGAAWPAAWAQAAASWSLRGRVESPTGADLSTHDGWEAVSLPPGIDLAVAVIPGAGIAGAERIVQYSPALHEVEDRAAPPRPTPPSWTQASIGAVLVDGGAASVFIARTTPSGPAARVGVLAGDRVVAIDGKTLASAASGREAIAASGVPATVVLDIVSLSGAVRRVSCETVAVPRLSADSSDDASRVVRAAWASVGAAAGGPNASLALANFASLLERSGRPTEGLDAWRRVRAIGGGALAARAEYAVGVGLEAAGKRGEAIEAFGIAKSEGLADDEPALAAAASDRLADLGVAPR